MLQQAVEELFWIPKSAVLVPQSGSGGIDFQEEHPRHHDEGRTDSKPKVDETRSDAKSHEPPGTAVYSGPETGQLLRFAVQTRNLQKGNGEGKPSQSSFGKGGEEEN
jgi:hypothetical protein